MNRNKEILDSFLQRKVNDASFDMQEAHWQHALRALENDEDKKGGWMLWLRKAIFSVLVVLLASLAWLGYSKFNDQGNNKKEILAKANTVSSDPSSNQANNTLKQTNSDASASAEGQNYPNVDVNQVDNVNGFNPTRSVPQTNEQNNSDVDAKSNPRVAPQNAVKVNADAANTNSQENIVPKQQSQVQDFATVAADKKKLQASNIIELQKNKSTTPIANSASLTINDKSTDNANPMEQPKPQEAKEMQSVSRSENKVRSSKKIATHKGTPMASSILELMSSSTASNRIQVQDEASQNPVLTSTNGSYENTQSSKVEENKKSTAKKVVATSQNTDGEKDELTQLQSAQNGNPEKVAPATATNDDQSRLPNTIQYGDDTIGKESKLNTIAQQLVINTSTTNTLDGKATDNAIADAAVSKDEPAKKVRSPKVYTAQKGLLVQASLSSAKAPISNSVVNTTYKPTAYLGIGYTMPLAHRLQMQSFMALTYLNALRNHYTVTSLNYGLGANHQIFDIQKQSILQLQVPLSLQYQVLPKHQVGIGFGASINLDVLSSVKDFNSNTYTNRWGYSQFYNPFNAFAMMNYQYQLYNNISITTSYQYGLTDITDNVMNRNVLVDNASRFNLGFLIKAKK